MERVKVRGNIFVAYWEHLNTRDWATAQSYKVTETGIRVWRLHGVRPGVFRFKVTLRGMLTQGSTRKSGYTLRNMLSYSHLFGIHDVSVSVGTEARRNEYKGVSTTGYGWVPEFGEMFSPWRRRVISARTGK